MRDYEQFISALKYRGSLFEVPKPNNWVTNEFLNTIKNWNVSNVKTMENMFFGDKNLTDASILLQWKNNGTGLNEQLNTKSMFNMTNCKNPFE